MVSMKNGRWVVRSVYRGYEVIHADFEYLYEALQYESDHLSRLDQEIIDRLKEHELKADKYKPEK
jgi:hypothetical protein